MPIDYDEARTLLEDTFPQVEVILLAKSKPTVDKDLKQPFNTIFKAVVQAYREALLGCVIARIQDKSINVRLPYVKLGKDAYNGRTLDEKVVNPFLHDKQIPCSKGPFLSLFRRSVKFDEETRKGVRDEVGYDAFLHLVLYIEETEDDDELLQFLTYLLFKFAELRESATVPLSKVQRMSLEQYEALISGLLATPSGGRFPVLLVVATLRAVKEFFGLNWDVKFQGINVADIASGGAGDITVSSAEKIVLAAEVTERIVDRSRLVSTFKTKIAPQGIEDYLFFVNSSTVDRDSRRQAHQYFSQGHEVNFLDIKTWILMCLATMGKRGRANFNGILVHLLEESGVPSLMKVAWNDQIAKLTE